MSIETCPKYSEFLNTECDRYLEDKRVDDNEMHQLKIEFDSFIENAQNSDLPESFKEKIDDLKLDYEFSVYRERQKAEKTQKSGRRV